MDSAVASISADSRSGGRGFGQATPEAGPGPSGEPWSRKFERRERQLFGSTLLRLADDTGGLAIQGTTTSPAGWAAAPAS